MTARFFLVRVLATAVVAAVLFFSAWPAWGAPVTLNMTHYSEISHPVHLAALQFAARVEKRTDGQVKINLFPDNQLGSPMEQLRQVKLGSIDLGLPSTASMAKYQKLFSLIMLPYLFDDYAHAHRVLDGPVFDWFAPLAEKEGFVILSYWEFGFQHLSNNRRPISQPQDMRDLKMRAAIGMPMEKTMHALGADVVDIPLPETYLAMAQKMIDGAENPLNVMYYSKLHEVQKYLSLTGHAYMSRAHVISLKSWRKLTVQQQEILREESRSAGDATRKTVEDAEAGLIDKLAHAGMQVSRPDTGLFRALTAPVYQEAALYVGNPNLQRFMEMVQDARRK